jgi:hypothetical protein
MDNENEEAFNILQYIKENLAGFILLALAFSIIYFVDYINNLNAIIYSNSIPISRFTPAISRPSHKFEKKRIKKH